MQYCCCVLMMYSEIQCLSWGSELRGLGGWSSPSFTCHSQNYNFSLCKQPLWFIIAPSSFDEVLTYLCLVSLTWYIVKYCTSGIHRCLASRVCAGSIVHVFWLGWPKNTVRMSASCKRLGDFKFDSETSKLQTHKHSHECLSVCLSVCLCVYVLVINWPYIYTSF